MTITRLRQAGNQNVMPASQKRPTETPSKSSDKSVLFCEQCYRYDKHTPVRVGKPVKVLLVILTAGLALIFWPKRCSCCGSIRF